MKQNKCSPTQEVRVQSAPSWGGASQESLNSREGSGVPSDLLTLEVWEPRRPLVLNCVPNSC